MAPMNETTSIPGTPSSTTTAISNQYWEETAKGIANVLAHLRGTWYHNNDILTEVQYRREKQQLDKYVTPIYYGVGAAVFLFLNFRVTGSPRFQAWRETKLESVSKMKQRESSGAGPSRVASGKNRSIPANKTTPQITNPPPHQMGYLEAKRERDAQAALSSMRLITDILVSVSVGTSGTLLLLQAHQDTMRQDFEEAPLVSGRSVVAEQMCGPFLELPDLRAVLVRDDNDNDGHDKDHDDMNHQTFQKFRDNCQRRQDLERRIRKQRDLYADADVSIPPAGLDMYRQRRLFRN